MKNDILGFAWAWLALAGRKALPRLVARFRNFERPEHAPRIPAGTHTCAVVYRRPPCVPCSREREKNSRPELKVLYSAKRAHFIHLHMYGRFVQLRYFFSKGSVCSPRAMTNTCVRSALLPKGTGTSRYSYPITIDR